MALSTQELIEELNDLICFDHDAIGAFDEAIDHAHEEPVREPMTRFRAEHDRHVHELSGLVRKLGGTPPARPRLRGVVRKTLTRVAGLAGTGTILKAMRSLVRRVLADEQRHLAWIEEALRTRPWAHAPSPQP